MVTTAQAGTASFAKAEIKHPTNFSHGEVPAKEARFIHGIGASLTMISR
jgi:hypothetical protein